MITLEIAQTVLLALLSLLALILAVLALRKARREGFISIRSSWLIGFLGLFLFIYLVISLLPGLPKIKASDWVQIFLVLGLVGVTGLYALFTAKQSDASVKMADGMARPVIDFKRDTARADIDRRTLEAYAASSGDASSGLSCILHNVGVGSAIDVRSFIQHPERGRLPFEFGTIESRRKTDRWILSISHESNRIALVACYEDIYGRTLKSSREVSIDKENHDWKLGRLKVVPVEEDKPL